MPNNTPAPTIAQALLERVSVEVRHTLHHVLGSVERISSEPLSRSQQDTLETCRGNLHELLRVVNDISELADRDAPGGDQEVFDVANTLEEFSSIAGLRALRKGLEFHWSVDRGTPAFILAHRKAMETVLYRLVDNSIKYTLCGEINLTVHWEPNGLLIFALRDTGPGIAPEVLQGLSGPVSGQSQTGLGLRLVRKQLDAIGGSVRDVITGPSGTVFTVAFPASSAVTPGGTHAVEYAAPSKPLRLLVAEDSDDSFAVLEAFVQDEGHQLVRALNGREAVEIFKTEKFDLVLMDVNMPVMDGYTATRAIRDWETQRGRSHLPVLLLSADGITRQMRIGASVGCSGYITKPAPKRELLSALRHYSANRS